MAIWKPGDLEPKFESSTETFRSSARPLTDPTLSIGKQERHHSIGLIKKGDAPGAGHYFTVTVDAEKLVTPSGKVLPYPTTIGTIGAGGEIRLWYPAASHPRDYKKAAMALLLVAFQKLKEHGQIDPGPHSLRQYKKHLWDYGMYI